jgi:hypothetical protein
MPQPSLAQQSQKSQQLSLHAATAPKRSGAPPPDLHGALRLLFAIAQKELELPVAATTPTVDEFLLAACAIESDAALETTLQTILGRKYAYTFLTNLGIVVAALSIHNVFPYLLHGLPIDRAEVAQRFQAGLSWYINYAFGRAAVRSADVVPAVLEWLEESCIPYIEAAWHRGWDGSWMLGALDCVQHLVCQKAYKRSVSGPLLRRILGVGAGSMRKNGSHDSLSSLGSLGDGAAT